MATHNLKSRIMQKSDTEANWKKATNFAPLDGEIIVYEVDDDNPKPRIKIGNGSDYVNDLPFINDILIINATDALPEENAFSKIQEAWQRKQMVILRENLDGIILFATLLTCVTDQALFAASSGAFTFGFTISSNNEMTVEQTQFVDTTSFEQRLTIINNDIDQKADKTALTGLASQSYVNDQISKIDFPVDSVNGKTGAVTLSAGDLSAYTKTQTNEKISTDISTHNTSTVAHNDIRTLITNLSDNVNRILNSTDVNLDQLSEIVKYIKDNRDLIDAINSDKIAVTDIIDNLISTETAKPLSANQGRELKALIDKKVETSVYNNKISSLETAIGSKLETGTFTNYQNTNDAAIRNINSALGQKANASDVETQLAGKANQTAVDAKLDKTAGTASRVMISDGNKNITTSSITTAQLGYLTDVTGNIQEQINTKASTGSVTAVENKVDNLKNFSKITVGSTNIEPDSSADTLTFTAGSGITLTGDATNDKITITANIDSVLSSTSTNPVQNKAIHSALAGKLDRISGSPEGHLAYVNSSGQLESSEITEETLVSAFASYGTGSIQNQLDAKAEKSEVEALKKVIDIVAEDPNDDTLDRISEIVEYTQNNKGLIDSITASKQDKITGAATSITDSDLTANYVLISDGNGKVTTSSSITTEKLNQLRDINTEQTIQNQLDSKASTSVATTTTNGLMSSTDKSKLDNIAEGAEVNQNTFSNFQVGSVVIAAETKTDTLTLEAGSSITLTPDENNDKITIAAVVDDSLNADSTNPVQNKVVQVEIENIKDSLDQKQSTITGAATSIILNDLTPSRVLISNSSGKVVASGAITSTELNCLDGLTSNIKNQFTNINTELTNLEDTKVTSTNAITAEQIMALCGTNIYSATGRTF